MKILKTAIVLLLILGVLTAFFVLTKPGRERTPEKVTQTPSPEVLGIPENRGGVEIKISERAFKAQYLKVENNQDITLAANFKEKRASQHILREEGCMNLISGGFYTEDFKPTGLFISEKSQIKGFVSSSLLNSIFSVNDFETPRITRNIPQDPLRFAVQAGPLLKENGYKLDLALAKDSEERRVAVGVTGENQTIFMVFYDPLSVFLGPKLEDLPTAVEIFEGKARIKLADAMNLDGGSASAFITQDFSLKELSVLGSYFCIK